MNGIRHFVRTNDYFIKLLGAACLLLMLGLTAGCGEDAFVCVSDDCVQPSNNTGTGTGTGTGGTTTGPSETTSGIKIGTGAGAGFVQQLIGAASYDLVSGGSTTLSVSLVDADNTAYTASAVQITYTKTCSTSTISPNPDTTIGGISDVTYVAGDCTSDSVVATATVEGTQIQASASFTITPTTTNLNFGSGDGPTFVANTLGTGTGNVGAGQPALSAGGSTFIYAHVVDGDNGNALYTAETFTVSFSSTCDTAGTASIQSTAETVDGIATATYIANGCTADEIIATVNLSGSGAVATVNIDIAPASVGSIQFISATPTLIAIAGTGGGGLQEVSELVFKVVDNNNDPVVDQIVNFELDTDVGGISLSSISGVTASDGTVRTNVQSGTIATPVRVTATTTDANNPALVYSTQSDALVISTGLADENSFSLSIGTFNPEAYNIDGVTVPVTVRAADHFNNPVPDGTSISFRTEGGSIGSFCLTVNGACSVNWVSQQPRPANGRVTILAFAIGNESFTDVNGNGFYDDGDIAGKDLPEPFVNDNESVDAFGEPTYDPASEEPVDFDGGETYTQADGAFTGVLCQHSTNCATATSLYVWEDTVIIMGSSSHNITATSSSETVAGAPVDVCIDPTSFTTVSFTVVGVGGSQYPPSGTSISVATSLGTIEGTSSWTVPNTAPSIGTNWTGSVTIQGVGTPDIGILTITVKTPAGTPDEVQLNVVEVADKVGAGCT